MSAKKKPVKAKKTRKQNPNIKPRIEKVTVNICVGEAGERLKKAEGVLQSITGHTPIQTLSKTTNKEWALRKRMPIGCKVTLRKEAANKLLRDALLTRENKIGDYAFDDEGNLSFGIPDHTLFKDQKYDPNVGIFGMDICITMEKPGYRIKRRRILQKKIHSNHRIDREETIEYISKTFNVEVV